MNSSARLPSQTDMHLHESQSLRNSTAALRRQSRSNWSLPKISAKREFSRKRPETFGNFAPEITRCAVWRLSRTRESRDFRACEAQVANYRLTQDWLAGDAVLIAPVSKQTPWYQGILQGILRFWGLETRFSTKKPLRCSHFSSNSLRRLSGKIF